jgi:uncharacterized protein YqgC (DUF456 family)
MFDVLQWIATGLGYMFFYVVMLAGVLLIPFGVPGQFLVAVAASVFAFLCGGDTLSLRIVFVLFGLAILAELIAGGAGFLGAGKAKGSIWSCVGAVVGGITGAIIGSMLLPFVGSILGVLSGTFFGAYAVEYQRCRQGAQATKVASGALVGRIVGTVAKVSIALVMIVIVTIAML